MRAAESALRILALVSVPGAAAPEPASLPASVPAAIAAPVPADAGRPPAPDSSRLALPAGGLRMLLGAEGYAWVADTARLAHRLAFARVLGYNAFVCHFPAPSRAPGDRGPAWVRGTGSGRAWTFSARTGPGNPGARQAWTARIAAVKRVTERAGMEFIPNVGAMGWGADYHAIDPATMSGEYLEIGIPEPSPNLFLSGPGTAFVSRTPGWGDSAAVGHPGPDSGDRSRVSMKLFRPGIRAAGWRIEAPWDAYLRCRIPVSAPVGAGDSAALKAYWALPGAPLPLGARLLAATGAIVAPAAESADTLELSFFVRRGGTYYLDVEYHCRAPGGGTLSAGPGSLVRTAPPRDRMVDAWGLRAYVSSRRPALENALWSGLRGARADSVWSSLSHVRATFRDGLDETLLRSPVDPLAPATRQITAGLFAALAEVPGPAPRFVHLGGDEVFNLHRSKRQRKPPFDSMGPAELFAHLVRDRVAMADSAFLRRHPRARLPAYIVYGDMLTSLHGRIMGTAGAADVLGAAPGLKGRLIVMPWYYSSMLKGIPGILPPAADPAGEERAFEGLLREDASRLARAGLDFIGLYSTDDGGTGTVRQAGGARAWARVCGESASAGPGKCRGLAYAGWDAAPGAPWGRNYNGMLLLSREWGGDPALAVDADGDGVLDSLKGAGFAP